jgi:hypothetical protein
MIEPSPEQNPVEASSSSLPSMIQTHFSAVLACAIAAIAWLTTGADVLTKHATSLQMIGFFALLSAVCSAGSQAIETLAAQATQSKLGLVLLLAGCNILKHLLMVCVLLFTLVIWRTP